MQHNQGQYQLKKSAHPPCACMPQLLPYSTVTLREAADTATLRAVHTRSSAHKEQDGEEKELNCSRVGNDNVAAGTVFSEHHCVSFHKVLAHSGSRLNSADNLNGLVLVEIR